MSNHSFLSRKIRHTVDRIIRMSYLKLGSVYVIVVLGCSLLYTFLFNVVPEHAPTLPEGTYVTEFIQALYFSVITATSVGYGDIVPLGISKFFAALEAMLGLSLFAILVSKPISERQEHTLARTHKLTLDGMLTNIREGFFIMRKDFDKLVKRAKDNTLDDHDMANFVVALEQGQILIEDIPAFYNVDRMISGLDERRELLLAESVNRTFERMLKTLKALDTQSVEWRGKREVVQSLDELLVLTDEVLPKWKIDTWEAAEAKISSIDKAIKNMRGLLRA